jgi:hypothetical protein
MRAILIAALLVFGNAPLASAEAANPKPPPPLGSLHSDVNLLTYCDSSEVLLQAACRGYIYGVFDTVFNNPSVYGNMAPACFPKQLTMDQITLPVIDWIRRNKRDPTNTSIVTALIAWHWNYPCPGHVHARGEGPPAAPAPAKPKP